ncbi:hypothetical protein VOLCADRAFT_97080 [Volvox carteri f. nagariensis]|uniref:Uncharacterized protein n=1 Tax=Volvox carteri f. nagariensis TaxID=3068 RepID=D8UBU6_VOLCA|nr:uncharacterized protein VOLCADRAFT_97080 [Volvox carteri f. nagariensis]EFJ42828.1 hypothetical protein VOLCADRAFT_97080 [Volvox carteri f. nagariensis]|eukprot:XP_002956088.1 hypothetical protein VOLCADRAFT_97080 [Volvox carteri f. nagariensis]
MSRRRKTRLLKIRKQLTAEAAAAETGGWAAAKKLEATKAALQALPIPPEDSGEAELAAATTPGTSFEAACATMKGLCHRGVCLGYGALRPDLVPPNLTARLSQISEIFRASTAGELAMFLELLRINHLVQAATKLGQHGALHDTLHDVLAQLWNSLYEHGMEPTKKAAQAAVQTAVSLREGPAAAALLLLTAQYTAEPLAGTEAPAVLGLLEAESPEVAAKLRQRLPQLGIASTT